MVGYFFGSYDTTYLETPYLLSAFECDEMASTKSSDNNKMSVIDNSAPFNLPFTGEGAWITTRNYTIANCKLETFNVS